MTKPHFAPAPSGVPAKLDTSHARRQISHDINHEIATIRLLTSLLVDAPDVGAESRRRAALILSETRWLEQLCRAYEDAANPPTWQACTPIRVDEVGAEVVDAMRQASPAEIRMSSTRVRARVDRLALWRVLRNILDNAIRAAGPAGVIDMRITSHAGRAVIEVDDDGPGFGKIDGGYRSYGLNIVQSFVSSIGGRLDIRCGRLGGCCVRVEIPQHDPHRGGPMSETVMP